jgi:hypothetical protein
MEDIGGYTCLEEVTRTASKCGLAMNRAAVMWTTTQQGVCSITEHI